MSTRNFARFGWSTHARGEKAVLRDLLDRYYLRVLGIAYQVLGDAELAAQATEAVFVQPALSSDDLVVWRAVVMTLQHYVARGFVVRPLVPLSQGWQGDLLQCLAQLAPLDRALVLLRYHEGLDIELLAQIWEREPQDLHHALVVARARLMDLLETT